MKETEFKYGGGSNGKGDTMKYPDPDEGWKYPDGFYPYGMKWRICSDWWPI